MQPRVKSGFVEDGDGHFLVHQLHKLNSELLPLLDMLLGKGSMVRFVVGVELDLVPLVELEQRLHGHAAAIVLYDLRHSLLQRQPAPLLQRVPRE